MALGAVVSLGCDTESGGRRADQELTTSANNDRVVLRRLRTSVPDLRSAKRPPLLDMAKIAPFAWERLFVFNPIGAQHASRVLREDHAVILRQVPAGTDHDDLLVFASGNRVVSAVRYAKITFGCLNGRHWPRARARFRIYRSMGYVGDGDPPSSLPTVIALSSSRSAERSRPEERCLQGFGVLH